MGEQSRARARQKGSGTGKGREQVKARQKEAGWVFVWHLTWEVGVEEHT